MRIIYSKLQGNVLQEFTDEYLKKHKELIKCVKEETEKQLTLTDVSVSFLYDFVNEFTDTEIPMEAIKESLEKRKLNEK